MPSPLNDAFFGLAVFSGAILCWLGVYCYRQWDEPGVVAFAIFSATIGVGTILSGIAGIIDATPGMLMQEETSPLWGNIAVLTWSVAMLPWVLFSLAYAGRYTRFRWRTVAVLALPLLGISVTVLATVLGMGSESVALQILGSVSTLPILFYLVIGVYLVVRTTSECGHLPFTQGLCLGLAGIVMFFGVNMAGIFLGEVGSIAATGAYATSHALATGLLLTSVFTYGMFDSAPAAGTIGERAIVRETDDLVFIVDQHHRIIQINPRVAETFNVSEAEPLGEPIENVLNITLEKLRELETYDLRVGVSKRQFDPEVSAFTDQHGRELGHIVSLHDVTERELRKQRLEVLNRVLRHNLRNSVDVIVSNAEAVTESHDDPEFTDERADTIIHSAHGLADLGQKARSIDRFVSRSVRETERDLVAVVADLIEKVQEDFTNGTGEDVTISFDAAETAVLVTDWEALTAALESAIENALEYASQSVTVEIESQATGYRITVADDGPGIPETELATLDAGTETPLQHSSGLGLWQIRWGVTKLNGTVSFETEEGTTVEMTIPDQSQTETVEFTETDASKS